MYFKDMESYKSIRIFKSPLLERLTHVHPLTPLVVWSPILAGLFWRIFRVHEMSVAEVLLLGIPGFLVWTLAEYVLHRYIFHFAGKSVMSQKFQFLIHGLHHADPIDPTRLVMPPAASFFIGGSLYLLFRVVIGPVLVEPFFLFFLVGYLCYDYTHYAVHHFKPQTRFGAFLKNSHMQHHYVSPESRWGVSSPLWDYVFGSLEDSKKKKEQTV